MNPIDAMPLALTAEEQMLSDMVQRLVASEYGLSQVRALREGGELGRAEGWRSLADLGLLGSDFAEEFGGLNLGLASLAIIQEQLGQALALTPMMSTILLAGPILQQAGTAAQKAAWLPGLIKGDTVLAFAGLERASRFDLDWVGTRATTLADGYQLDGEKALVLDAADAAAMLVSARTSGAPGDADGISLFLVPAAAAGLSIDPHQLIDGRPAAWVKMDGVRLGNDALVGGMGEGAAVIHQIVDRATVCLCAEMLGGMQRAFDLTVAYLREREQFGVKIGTFQALQHRAARMFVALSLARPTVRAAALAAGQGGSDFAKRVAHAKAQCCDSYLLIANEAIQMHGGIGMTEEYPVGHYLKAARVAEMLFGDAHWHRARWATLHGY